MTRLAIESGCKVGWEIYDDEQEAQKASFRAARDAESKALRGYDFGYCVPGEVRHYDSYTSRHVNDDGTRDEYGEVWIVTTP